MIQLIRLLSHVDARGRLPTARADGPADPDGAERDRGSDRRRGGDGTEERDEGSLCLTEVEKGGKGCRGGGSSRLSLDAMAAIVGSSMAFIAREIDIPSVPRGAMATLLSLLPRGGTMAVRESAALALSVIAGRGYGTASTSVEGLAQIETAEGERCALGFETSVTDTAGGERHPVSWRRFCANMVGGDGAQVKHASTAPFRDMMLLHFFAVPSAREVDRVESHGTGGIGESGRR